MTQAQPKNQRVAIAASAKSTATPAAQDVRLASYDPNTGNAVLSAEVKSGQLIVSAPTPTAPKGALRAVTSVQPNSDGTVGVATRPATVSELLGSSSADGQVAVDPHTISVTPLVKDLKASLGPSSGSASGTLQLDVNAPIPLPGGASVAASGSLQLHPSVHFTYQGIAAKGSPKGASIGFDLGAQAEWRVHGELGAATGPVRMPFAELHASPVFTVAGLPIVVNLGLTCFLEIGADGKVTVDADQEFTGNWGVHTAYTPGSGWKSDTGPSDTKVSPVHLKVAGKAAVRTGLGATASVALYDAVGVQATLEPYLRAQADGTLSVDTGSAPQAKGSWGLYGGLDLTGELFAQLKIFGTPIAEKRFPFPVLHREWPITQATGSLPTGPTG